MIKALLKIPLLKSLLISKENCFALKSNRTFCDSRAIRGTRYCWRHQSKLPWTVVIFTTLLLPGIKWGWAHYYPPEERQQLRTLVQGQAAHLVVIEAKADLRGQAPIVQLRFRNSGAIPARQVRFHVSITDLGPSKVFVRFDEMLDQIAPGTPDGFWAELPSVTNTVPPWPEIAMLIEWQFRSGTDKEDQAGSWLGVLKNSPVVLLANPTAAFVTMNAEERHIYMSNLRKRFAK